MTTMKNAGDTPATEPDADAVVLIRNMNSRAKTHPCACVHCTFGRNKLRTKHNLAGDLASHMFGHLVSTEVARDVLTTFIVDGVIQVFKGVVHHNEQLHEGPFDPHSEDVQRALEEAFKVATAHDCIRLRPGDNAPEQHAPPADQEEKEEKTYIFRWRILPQNAFSPDELVSFFNEIIDRAFAAAKPHFATKMGLRYRFAASNGERHFVPLAYDSDQDIRPPDFVLLPIEAFSGASFNTVDKRYLSFSAARLVGETTKHLADGLDRVQWHSEGLERAQPWVYYVLGMTATLTQDVIFFSRVDHSDWEHLALLLWDGRGCIEFIRILLGLALADGVDLGQNPNIQLMCVARTFQVKDRGPPSDEASPAAESDSDSDEAKSETSNSSSCDIAPGMPCQNPVEKRDHSQIEKEDDNEEDQRLKKLKIVEDI
ncbi:hypothetical protein EV363DRAFT_1307538 [Boletus edulis]|nr:hypothetical protein EV363DRAFT_1307538 [Boletus edulis]